MSTETIRLFRRIASVGMCAAMLMSYSLILAPGVGAASDTNKTETATKDSANIMSAEDALLMKRAITIDEAKKEAQEVVTEQLAIQKAAEEAATEAASKETAKKSSKASKPAADSSSESYSSDDEYADYSSTSDDEDYESYESSYPAASGSSQFLMDIDNPDPYYTGCTVYLNDADRDITERILMGEAGSQGFDGMALVAQCIRDTYVSGSYSSMKQLLVQNGYYGSTSITPSQTAKEVVNYIFDQGGSAVQHSIRVFYASNLCSSPWHESQQYVCSYGYVRYFDLW